MEIIEETVTNNQSFPQGGLISSRLSSHAVGNLLEVHDFLCRFKKVIGVEEPISFEKLEQELLCPSLDGVGKSSILGTFETFVHSVLLPELVSKLLDSIASLVNTKSALKVQLDMLLINEVTWPEVVRRYIMAYLIMGGRLGTSKINDKNKTKLIHCLLSDCGIFYSSSTNAAVIDLDAKLLGRAIYKVFGKRVTKSAEDDGIPEWAKVLDPVKRLPTNVGSRIRSCIHEALNKNPPEWAKKILEDSISKAVYKGNASGPTKRAVIAILKRVASDAPHRQLPHDVNIRTSCDLLKHKVIMKKCRSILRNVVAKYDSRRDFSDLMGNLKSDEIKVVFESASRRPLDFPTVDLRLLHDTYGGSREAFLEDARELWINLKTTHVKSSSLVKLADDMSKDFNLRYENEVVPLLKKLSEYNMSGQSSAEVKKELEELLASIEIPTLSLEAGICKVCGINRDDDKVLLCDTEWCNAEYHTYCLKSPLSEIPQGNWHCPACDQLEGDQAKGILQNFECVDRSCREEYKVLNNILSALEETDYSNIETHKKIFLLKFLVDKSLDTNCIRKNIGESSTKVSKKLLGMDSMRRIYWGFPYVSSSWGIVVENTEINPIDHPTSYSYDNCGEWCLFQTEEEINKLVDYLTINEPSHTELRDSILEWQKTMLSGLRTGRTKSVGRETVNSVHLDKVPSHNSLTTKASVLLKAQYDCETTLDSGAKDSNRTNVDCLKPVSSDRRLLGNSEGFSEVGKNITVAESSSKALMVNTPDILSQLKLKLLDMEAALPAGAKRSSMDRPELRSAWCAFVKSANTIYKIVEATLALETMIKTKYIKNNWWWYWSSVSTAAQTSTVAALALRIYTLDAAIKYQKGAATSDQQESRKRTQTTDKSKVQKKAKESKEKVDKMDVVRDL